MSRLANLGSLRSIVSYGADELDSDEEVEILEKKRKLDAEDVDRNEGRDDEMTREGGGGKEREEEGGGGSSEFDIVMSDEDDDNSRQASVIVQPRVNIASRLVSYGDDEDEGTKPKDVEDKIQASDEAPDSVLDTTEKQLVSPEAQTPSPTEESKTATTEPEKDNKQKEEAALPEKLREHLAAIKAISVTLPEEPEGRCSNSLQEKIEKLLETKQRNGRNLTDTIQRKKNFRNPSIYEKLVSFCALNETGTNYPPNIYDPFSWTEESFYENLSKLQKENHEKKQRDRSKVEFVTGTKKSSSADDASKKRKSKWDVTSSGTAAPASSNTQHTVAAAKAKIINAIATVQAKK